MTPDERELLEDWRRYGTSPLIRNRALAVIINSQGKSAYFIAKILSRKDATVYSWLNRFKKYRLSSILTKYRGNINASKLTLKQRKQIAKVLSQPPSDYGIPKQFWQVKDLKR